MQWIDEMGRIVLSVSLEERNGMHVIGVEKMSEQQRSLLIFRRGVKRGGLNRKEVQSKINLIFLVAEQDGRVQ